MSSAYRCVSPRGLVAHRCYAPARYAVSRPASRSSLADLFQRIQIIVVRRALAQHARPQVARVQRHLAGGRVAPAGRRIRPMQPPTSSPAGRSQADRVRFQVPSALRFRRFGMSRTTLQPRLAPSRAGSPRIDPRRRSDPRARAAGRVVAEADPSTLRSAIRLHVAGQGCCLRRSFSRGRAIESTLTLGDRCRGQRRRPSGSTSSPSGALRVDRVPRRVASRSAAGASQKAHRLERHQQSRPHRSRRRATSTERGTRLACATSIIAQATASASSRGGSRSFAASAFLQRAQRQQLLSEGATARSTAGLGRAAPRLAPPDRAFAAAAAPELFSAIKGGAARRRSASKGAAAPQRVLRAVPASFIDTYDQERFEQHLLAAIGTRRCSSAARPRRRRPPALQRTRTTQPTKCRAAAGSAATERCCGGATRAPCRLARQRLGSLGRAV